MTDAEITLPDPVGALAAAALAEMQADPRHHMPPRRRRAIYAALAGAPDPALRAVPDWLAVLAAERVLPLFQARCPDDELPPALLATAIAVLEGRADAATAAETEARGYRASKNAWGYEDDELPWPVGLAADAAYHALKEARGHKPLTDLDAYLRPGTLALQPGEARPHEHAPPTRIRPAHPPPAVVGSGAGVPPAPGGDSFNDEALCQMDNSDTASIAAVAAASSEFGPTCDPERLRAFWSWWLLEALPGALAAARRGQRA